MIYISHVKKKLFPYIYIMTNIYKKLGVPTIINASGSMTELGGSVMEPKAAAALAEASQHYVHLPSLKRAVEKRIAGLLEVQDVCISSCATAGLILSAAACMACTDEQRIKALPVSEGFPNVFLTPEVHRNRFDHALQVAGGKIRTFDTDLVQFEKMVSQKEVAGVYFTLSWFCQGDYIPIQKASQIAHKYKVPLVIDAAAQLPPLSNFRRFLDEGADLVVFSGGKTIRGPQVSGLVLGNKKLVEACRLNNSPNIETIGRGMKISKEEIVALLVALETYLERDHEQDQKGWKDQLHFIKKEISHLDHLEIKLKFPYGPGYQLPYLELSWDHRRLQPSARPLIEALIQYQVPIYARFDNETALESRILIYAHTLKEGQEIDIANALKLTFKTNNN